MNRSRIVALLALSLSQSPSRCSRSEGQSTRGREPAPRAPAAAQAPDASAPPETPFERELDALDESPSFNHLAVSGDGTKIAWAEWALKRGDDSFTSVLRTLDRSDPAATPRTITAGASAKMERSGAWSPDGKTLAFLSDPEPKSGAQVYLATPGDPHASPRKLTDLVGAISAPRFSPDGKTIAFLFAENATDLGPIAAIAPVQGEAEAHVPVQRLMLVDVASGQAHPLTRPDLYVYEYAWSPDGTQIVTVAAPPPGDRHWYVAKLFVMDARTGQERLLYTPALQIAGPCWSPDGKEIAFIGGLMSDEGSTGGDVFVLPSAGGAPARDRTPGFHGSAQWLAWPKGDRIVFRAIVDGANAIEAVDAAGKIEALWSSGDSSLHALALSDDGTVSAIARESFSTPEEVWVGEIGKWQQVTHANDGLRATWGKARSLAWKSDGKDVQGWLVEPSVVDPKNRAPLIVIVHGGPAAAALPAFDDRAALAGEGYFVFYPNPRGSFGGGEAFTSANVKDFGYGDMRDIITGVDEVLRDAPVDGDRVGVYGWSYGGFMAMWMVTQTTRFRAAVAGAGVANWQSYWGENEISDWMIPYFGASVYDDPKVYARSSPIEFIKQAKTPTLVLVGENDGECPAPQSFEFWRGLQAQGVETQLVVYPGEGHGFRKAEHRRDRMKRVLRWFDAHLGSGRR